MVFLVLFVITFGLFFFGLFDGGEWFMIVGRLIWERFFRGLPLSRPGIPLRVPVFPVEDFWRERVVLGEISKGLPSFRT